MQIETIITIVVGFLISLYFYLKSLRNKNPYWATRSNNIVDGYTNKHENLQVKFKKRNIETLTISKVIFWNNGKETILKSDLVTVDHLRILPKNNAVILDVKVLVQNNDSSQFKVQLEEKDSCAFIEFNYLDEKQGAVIQVVHTGKSSEDLILVGTIIGVKVIRQVAAIPKWVKFLKRYKFNDRIYRNITGGFGIVFGVINILSSLVVLLLLYFHQPMKISPPTLASALSYLFLGAILLYEGWFILRISNIAPKGLEIFDND